MKKSAVFAAMVFVAMSGLFAQTNNSSKPAASGNKPPFPPDMTLPDESVVKAYHDSQLSSLKTLTDAQVQAGICTREQADAAVAVMKAVQSECKGECILRGRTDIPFGVAHHRGPAGGPAPMARGGGHRGPDWHCGGRGPCGPMGPMNAGYPAPQDWNFGGPGMYGAPDVHHRRMLPPPPQNTAPQTNEQNTK